MSIKHPDQRAIDPSDQAQRPIAWRTAKHALALVARVLDEAREEGLVSENVARGLTLPRREETDESWTWLTPDEIAAVLELDLTEEQRTALTVAIYQGLRLGELAALRWDRVELDPKRPELVIAASWQRGTKSGRIRRIPLLEPARAAFISWQPDPAKRRGLVFPSPQGGMYARGYCWGWDGRYDRGEKGSRKVAGVRERAGIERRVRFHDLRHTCAANLVSGSWGRAWRLEEVRVFLGHSSITTTEIYAHLGPDALHPTARDTALIATQPDANLTAPKTVVTQNVLKSFARPERFELSTLGSVERVCELAALVVLGRRAFLSSDVP